MVVGALNCIMALIVIGLSASYLGPKTKFGYENFACAEVMAAVHSDSFTNMPECGKLGKYTRIVKSFDELKAINDTCAYSDLARFVWEKLESPDAAGCLNL